MGEIKEKAKQETAEKVATEKAEREATEKAAKEKAETERKAREEIDRVAKQNTQEEIAERAARQKVKREETVAAIKDFLQTRAFKRIWMSVTGMAVIALSVWGFSNLNFNSNSTPSPSPSLTPSLSATFTPKVPSPTSSPLTTDDYPCSECHSDFSLLNNINSELTMSQHGNSQIFTAGISSNCSGCHSGIGFPAMIKAGLNPSQVETADPNSTNLVCETCHQIHKTNTELDWELTTTEAVALFAFENTTYDGGGGNLCVNCHQPRLVLPDAVDGNVTGITGNWSVHSGAPSVMLLGLGGSLEGKPSAHFTIVEDTCNFCHMGENTNHTFKADITTCQACHADAEIFDINGVQTETQALLYELEELLVVAGVLDQGGTLTATEAPESVATALFDWLYVKYGDKSLGVHNPSYTKALLLAGIDTMENYLSLTK